MLVLLLYFNFGPNVTEERIFSCHHFGKTNSAKYTYFEIALVYQEIKLLNTRYLENQYHVLFMKIRIIKINRMKLTQYYKGELTTEIIYG